MTLPIERARSRRPITWLTILGVLLLPALIGGILVMALQNPTDRLESMTAAVVNLDKPVTIDGQYTPLGRQLTAGLVEGSDEADSNLTWVISNEKDAAEGLGDGTYQAVVTIPKSFSADATSAGAALKDGSGTAEQAKIQVTTQPDGRVADGLITQQLAATAASTMGTMLSQATIDNVLVGFTTIGDQIGDAADGAVKLADGARSAADGAAELPDGASKLASGADSLADGASQLARGLGTIESKSREAGAGANQLGAGLTAGAAQLERDGLVPAQLSSGLGQVTDLAKLAAETAAKAAEAAGGAAQAAGGAQQAASGAAQAAGGAQQAASGAAQAAGGAQQAASGVKQGLDGIAPALQQLAQQCDTATQPQLCAQLTALAGSTDALRAPAGTAADLAGTAAQTAQTAADTADKAASAAGTAADLAGTAAAAAGGAQKAATGASQAAGGAQQASTAVGAGLTQFDKQASSEIASQMRTAGGAASQLGGGLGQLADGVAQSAAGASGLSTGASQLGDGASALADGAGQLVGGLDTLASGTGDLADGLETASTSLPSFDEQQSKNLAAVISDPVKASAEAGGMFGPTAIPLLAAVVLWFGALASFIALHAVPGNPLTSRRSSIGMVLRGFWPAAVIGAAQGVLVALIVQIVADYSAAEWWSFAGFAVLAGISFAAVNQALVAVLGGIGRWISALVGVIAVATGLISTIPAWLAGLGAAMPTAPALGGMIAGSGSAFAGLVVWGVLALGAATLAVATRRSASTKAALALA